VTYLSSCISWCEDYCTLHEENILGAIFSVGKELRMAKPWGEVELAVWGELKSYKSVSWRASTFLMHLRVAAVHTEVGIKSTGFRVTTNNSSCSLLKYHIFSIIEINLHAYSNGKWNQSQIYTCMYQSWTLFIYLLRKIQCICFLFLQKFNWILY